VAKLVSENSIIREEISSIKNISSVKSDNANYGFFLTTCLCWKTHPMLLKLRFYPLSLNFETLSLNGRCMKLFKLVPRGL
jgi:hypothetical protein